MIHVLIIEDLPILQVGLRMRLSAEPDLSVIEEAADFEAALDLAKRCPPDVVVLDVDPPCVEVIPTDCQLREICRHARVIFLALNDNDETRQRAREVGAAAFVAKSMPVATLVTAIRQIAN